MRWPDSEGERIPEGHYSFKLTKDADLRSFTKSDGTEGRKIVIYAIGLNDKGQFRVVDSFVPWDQRYGDLKNALGVESGKDMDVNGAIFEADIIYQPDKNDPTKSYPRIVNIKTHDDVPPINDGDDIPF